MTLNDSTLTFRFEEDDLEAFQRFFWRTSRFVQRRMKRARLMFGVLAVVFLLAGSYQMLSGKVSRYGDDANSQLGSIFIGFGVVEAIICVSIPSISLRSTIRQNNRFMKEHGLERQFGSRTLRIDGDVVEHTYSMGTNRHKIADMLPPALTDMHCFFMLTEASAIVVPKTKITAGNLDALLAEFRRVQAAAR